MADDFLKSRRCSERITGFTLGQLDNQGHDQMFTPALDRLQQATSQLEQAESARIMKGALYQVVKDDGGQAFGFARLSPDH